MPGRGGRRPLPAEVRARIAQLRLEHPDWSLRAIGEAAGVSKDSVRRVLAAVAAGGRQGR